MAHSSNFPDIIPIHYLTVPVFNLTTLFFCILQGIQGPRGPSGSDGGVGDLVSCPENKNVESR